MKVDRRFVMAGAAALALPVPLRAEAATTLRAAAAARGIGFGTAIGARGFADPAYRALIERECAVVTPENAMKWPALCPGPDRWVFDDADRIVGWATRAGMAVRGHTLFWPRQDRLPGWVANYDFGTKPIAAADQMVGRHVVTVAKRYAGKVGSFDVVNEVIDPETGSYRDSVLAKASGNIARLVALAFQLAREAAPKAELAYNDYMDWGDGSARHRAGVLRLLEGLRKADIPIDALGIQAHVTAGGDAAAIARREREWRAFLDEVTGMGLKLVVTEFDVDDRDIAGPPGQRDRAVADYARAWSDVLLAYRPLTGFVTWGLSDRFSWLDGFRPRGDGQHKRGCPYDDQFRPKPMRDALVAAFGAGAAR